MREDPQLDWTAIRHAVVERQSDLGLKNKELASRMDVDPRTVTNLRKSTVNEATLRDASEALGWPRDGLLRIGRGEASSDHLDTSDTEPSSDVERRLERLEDRIDMLIDQVARLTAQRRQSSGEG